MEKDTLNQLLIQKDATGFSENDLKILIDEYPWFELPRILHLLKLKQTKDPGFRQKLSEYAIFLHDRKQVYRILNTGMRLDLIDKYSGPNNDIKTDSQPDDSPKELLEFSYKGEIQKENPISDNSTGNNNQKDKPNLIERFLLEDPGPIKADMKPSISGDVSRKSVEENDHLLTDTLAKIYVKQGLYSKAIFAYEKLSLKYPEKSVYFASQIKEIKEITNKK